MDFIEVVTFYIFPILGDIIPDGLNRRLLYK
jgi:hypothetical protein